MSESFSWDGERLTVDADTRHPNRVCGTDLTHTHTGMTDDRGHAVAFVHVHEHLAAVAALNVIHAMHCPNPEGIVPWCDMCSTPAPCETRRLTTAVMDVTP